MKTKKLFILILTLFVFLSTINTDTTRAALKHENSSHTTIIMEPDGGYYVKTITESPSPDVSVNSVTTKSSKVYYKYYNNNNILCWKYVLDGTFYINFGVSSKCTNVTANFFNYKSGYTLNYENHSYSGNKATGSVTVQHKDDICSKTLSIVCDKNGNFS